MELLKTGTEEKRPKAARHLARCYEHGFGVEKDFRKAWELYRSCADDKDISSAYYVGYLMKYGPEEIRDEERSKYYLEKPVLPATKTRSVPDVSCAGRANGSV
ncbi:MAG: sel1 repeat family protein [Lachnospiraceae bacterium]|nr:sel1 repeat family protein [Lachnospiraceae bacterium]